AVKYVEGERRRMVNAEGIEKAVLDVVRDVLSHESDLRIKVLDFLKKEAKFRTNDERNVEALRSQQKQLLCKVEFLMDRVSIETKSLTERKIQEVEGELSLINRKLKQAEGDIPAALRDVQGAADTVVRHFRNLGSELEA